MRLPVNHDKTAVEVAKQNGVRVLCGASHAEAHVSVCGSAKRFLCGLNSRLPDANVTAAFSRARGGDQAGAAISRGKIPTGEHGRRVVSVSANSPFE